MTEFLPKSEIALIKALAEKKEREIQGRFIAEGKKLCLEALHNSIDIEYAVMVQNPNEEVLAVAATLYHHGVNVYTVGDAVFERISNTQNPQGILCIINKVETNSQTPTECFLAFDSIADPGNLGTIIRTADWFGIHTFVLGGTTADPYNPKVLRASMGSVFRSNFIITSHLEVYLDALKEKNNSLELYGMTLEEAHSLSSITHSAHQWGLIVGSEAHGISEEVQSCITTKIHIPGHGLAESLNVGIASGIALYHFSLLTSQ